MTKVRVSVALPAEARDRLADEARARGQSLDAHLRSMILHGGQLALAESSEELARAKSDARSRAGELGEARRRIRELEIRLNTLLAGPATPDTVLPPWSLDLDRRSASERIAWWTWLARGIQRLRKRYGVVCDVFENRDGDGPAFWWHSPGRVRAIAIALAWEEMLDQGGQSIPTDPRFAEAFLDYLWRISHRERAVNEVGELYRTLGNRSDWAEKEQEAWRIHLAEQSRAQAPPAEVELVGEGQGGNPALSKRDDGPG